MYVYIICSLNNDHQQQLKLINESFAKPATDLSINMFLILKPIFKFDIIFRLIAFYNNKIDRTHFPEYACCFTKKFYPKLKGAQGMDDIIDVLETYKHNEKLIGPVCEYYMRNSVFKSIQYNRIKFYKKMYDNFL